MNLVKYEIYMEVEHDYVSYKGTSWIVDKWVDSKGNVWYKEIWRENWTKSLMYALDKVSKDGSTLEYVWGYNDFPTEADLNTSNSNYKIYYSQ